MKHTFKKCERLNGIQEKHIVPKPEILSLQKFSKTKIAIVEKLA